MPPAAPSFSGSIPPDNNKLRINKKIESVDSATSPRRLRKNDTKKEECDIRTSKKFKVQYDDENCEVVQIKRRRLSDKSSDIRKEPGRMHGDSNLTLSGDEDDFSDSSSDDDSRRIIESSEEEDNVSESLNKKKKFYIVQNDGRPAELYRTDLIHSLRNHEDLSEDSDDVCGLSNGVLRLTDRWREEWNHGVQVPMNPKSLPYFKVALNEMKLPSRGRFGLPAKYIGIRPEGSAPLSYVTPATHACTILPKRRLYQADRMDEIWLKDINQNKAYRGQKKIDMVTFMIVMDMLEISCYERIHELLIAPLHSPNFDGIDEEAACDICRGAESEPDDSMVFCDGCNMCVHMSCYGLNVLPEDEWICQKCALGYGFSPPCLLCPTRGGALKCTKQFEDGKCRWAHVACALWIPECRFGNAELREPITSLDEIPDDRWQMKCCVCDTRQGACIQCTYPSCTTAFHVTCGLRRGLEMRIDQDPNPEIDAVRFLSYCPRHSGKRETGKKWAEEEQDDKDNQELKKLEDIFYLHVDYEMIAKRSGLDKLIVSDIYEYWKQKRFDNKGKPLIRNPHDEIKLTVDVPIVKLPQPGDVERSRDSVMTARLNLESGRIQKSLDMGRSLLYLVVKREKEKHRELVTQWKILENIWEQTAVGVPLSQRVVDTFCEIVESLMEESDREILKNKSSSSPKEGETTQEPPVKMQEKTSNTNAVKKMLEPKKLRIQSSVSPVKRSNISLRRKSSANMELSKLSSPVKARRSQKIEPRRFPRRSKAN
ncbi:unnamed protein product [Auanema sp. JU1783]|nr:unnamed protein product [Auanema sp. JU1783]